MSSRTDQDHGPTCRACGQHGFEPWMSGLEDYLFGVPGHWTLVRCKHCGTLSLDPTPTDDQVASFYATYFTHATISTTEVSGDSRPIPARRRAAAQLRASFERRGLAAQAARAALSVAMPRAAQTLRRSYAYQRPGTTVRTALDYGCGNGDLVRRLAALGIQAQGVDFDDQALQAGRQAGLDVRHISACGQMDDQSFDLLTCMNVIEHVSDPGQVLALFRRLLRPTGVLMLETPNAASWMAGQLTGRWRGLEVPRHLSVYTPDGLCALLDRHGFDVLRHRFVPAAGFMASASKLDGAERLAWRLASPLLDLAGLATPSRREVIFVEARPRR